MKAVYLTALVLFASVVQADQRFETVGGFCHFVTPDGFMAGNDDDEVFFANCENSIHQNADGTGSGTTIITVAFPYGDAPFDDTWHETGAETGVNCVMVDSNGTQYVTLDWKSDYIYRKPTRKRPASIKFSMSCRNGAQQ